MWEKFESSNHGGGKYSHGVTVGLPYILSINTGAVERYKFTDIRSVSLWFNDETREIGIKKEDERLASCYALCRNVGMRTITCKNFFKRYDLHRHLGHHSIEYSQEHDMLVVRLGA